MTTDGTEPDNASLDPPRWPLSAGPNAAHSTTSLSSDASSAPKARNVGKIIGFGIALLGVVAGGAFAYTQITGGETANTPEQAIESFYRSLENGDAIGMAKVLAPGERDIMLDSIVPMMSELSRLEILDKDLDLNKVQGYTAEVSNFKATSKPIRRDLAEVRVTGGNIKASIDPKKLPLGAFLRDILGSELDRAKVERTDETLRIGERGDPLVMQKIGKRWYLSLNYTAAESARRTSPESFGVPPKGGGVPAKGAESAEAAVAEMMTAAGHFDVRRMIELLPPDEFPAVHDYAGQFIGDAEDLLAQARKVARVDITSKLRSKKITDDRVLVSIVDLPTTLKIDSDGTVVEGRYAHKALNGRMTTGTGEVIRADFKDECLTLVVDDETKKGCGAKGIADLFSQLSGKDLNTTGLSDRGVAYGQKCINNKKRPDFGMVAVKRDGKWFVSPTRTMLDSITALMKSLDRRALECIKGEIEKTINSLQGTFLPSATDSIFEAPLDPESNPFATVNDTVRVSVDEGATLDTSDFTSVESTLSPS